MVSVVASSVSSLVSITVQRPDLVVTIAEMVAVPSQRTIKFLATDRRRVRAVRKALIQ